MININTAEHSIITVKQGDPGWLMQDGYVLANRAGVEISNHCPYEYRLMIQECINQGWLKPVANVYERELMWEKLNEQL